MNERNPAKHPAILVGICAVVAAMGAYGGKIHPPYGNNVGAGILIGGLIGACLGLFFAMLWALAATLWD